MKINICGQDQTLKEIIESFFLDYNTAKMTKSRTKRRCIKSGKEFTEWRYKFLLFEKVFDKWYCKVI